MDVTKKILIYFILTPTVTFTVTLIQFACHACDQPSCKLAHALHSVLKRATKSRRLPNLGPAESRIYPM